MPASATIKLSPSTDYYPAKNCAWAGVAGKVFGTDGKPLLKQLVQLGGTWDGKLFDMSAKSGDATAYGSSGFELYLGDHPVASTKTLWIQLLDSTGKIPLTEKIYFDTSSDCTQNLVMVVFTMNR